MFLDLLARVMPDDLNYVNKVFRIFFPLQVCNFEKNCPNGDDESLCGTTDFETDMGGWQDASSTAYGWYRINASLAQYPNCTAPDSDHTTGLPEGYYVWAPAKLSGNDFKLTYTCILLK